MTIMVCAVLIAFSTFFYAPMDVSASESVSSTGSVSDAVTGSAYKLHQFPDALLTEISLADFGLNLADSSYYHVTLIYDLDIEVLASNNLRFINVFGTFFVGDSAIAFCNVAGSPSDSVESFTTNEGSVSFVSDGLSLKSILPSVRVVGVIGSSGTITNRTLGFTLNVSNVSVESISADEAGQYESGYNAGYADGVVAGEDSGYSSGYSDGYSDGQASVDTDSDYDAGYQAGESAGYESGFQAGVDSVDTQTYYDAGYQAGYDIAYQAGYDTGYVEAYDIAYENGYQSAMDRIASWGADTSDYPLLIQQTDGTFDLQFDFIQPARVDDVISEYCDVGRHYSGINFNPNHTYRLDFTYHDFDYDYSDSYFTASYSFWLYWGSCSFPITVGTKDDVTSSFYISGDKIGTGLKFRCDVSGLEAYSEYFGVLHYYINDCTLKLYDMGPSGDTQNHIANQTDQLTNGYDTSSGDSANSSLSTGLNEFETAENSLFATATTGMKDFTFFDFESVPAMLTAVTFITSIMGSWFEQAGGASGVGIVLSILFSVMLVSMVLGLYRLYQSAGHRAEARERHRERMEQWKKGK